MSYEVNLETSSLVPNKQNKTKQKSPFFFSYGSSICSCKNQRSKQKIKINGSEEER